MKKISFILSLSFILSSASLKSQQIIPTTQVEECVELMSIVFQLAGAQEYSVTRVPGYANDIVSYFEPYKNHELIKWIPELRQQYGIGYDAVASYAIRLKIENGKIRFLDNIRIDEIDSRWTKEVAEEFLIKLNQFYADSKFNDFFIKHTSLYNLAVKDFSNMVNLVNYDWFERYYGTKPKGRFHLIVSLTNGMGNYGPHIDYETGERDVYAIIGTPKVDSLGNPVYKDERYLSLIVHEFNHSYCNALIDENYAEIKKTAEEFYRLDTVIFQRQAYGSPETVMYEMLVRASEVQYLKDAGKSQQEINKRIAREQKNGFTWIDKLSGKLDEYERQRDKYPTLRSFMPDIVNMINGLTLSDSQEQ